MDKYTVDLDKVLNDFEYSELTDQYNGNASYIVSPCSSQVRRPRAPNATTPVKHTVSNVFQSLNEYLNADVPLGDEKDVIRELPFLHDNSEKLELLVSKDDSLTLANLEVNNESPQSEELSNSSNADAITDSELDAVAVIKNDMLPYVQDVSESIEEESQSVECKSELTDDVVVKVNNFVNEENVCVKNESISENVEYSKTELPEDKSVYDSKCLTELKTEPICESNDVIGFDMPVEANEAELHNYLNELEQESIDADDQKFCATQSDTLKDSDVVEDNTNENVENSVDRENEAQSTSVEIQDNLTLTRPNSLHIESDPKKEFVDQPGSTPFTNLSISKVLSTDDIIEQRETESITSPSPSLSDVSTISADSFAAEQINSKKLLDVECTKSTELPQQLQETMTSISENPTSSIQEEQQIDLIEEPTGLTNIDTSQFTSNVPIANHNLGKSAPLWIPDSEALNCLHCDIKFTMIKRRHHCRACGLVLCSKCCNAKYKLEYLDTEARVCNKCYAILEGSSDVIPGFRPNPNNPMEYCSTVPPPLQQDSSYSQNIPPTVMVPVSVLKRQGSSKSRTNKSVMFCDGIRPGSELTDLDNDNTTVDSKGSYSKYDASSSSTIKKNNPLLDPITKSYIPSDVNSLPSVVHISKSDITYSECSNDSSLLDKLKEQSLTFAIRSNLYIHVKIIHMDCCINKWAWCFSTEGMISVGQDEIVYLIEILPEESILPKDVLFHLLNIYEDAKKGSSIVENGVSIHVTQNFLDSKNHAGFLYIRPTFQCLQNVIIPKEPYLVGILIHRWEMPWAKIFPLRLILRLGAEYRYYPCPLIATRQRESVFVEIGHTIINLLADFRNYSYTLPSIRGLTIHMEDRNTTIEIPSNRYELVVKSLNNSSEHILAFAGNFSLKADSHLVCMQDTSGNNENVYTTHAINIHNRPRKVTGASFLVFNGALKSTSGLTAKSSIIEDGLMIQIPPEHMLQLRESLRNMKNHTIQCGCINAVSDESVSITWVNDDINFNLNVVSAIDNLPLSGIPSIRVHNGKDYFCNGRNRTIRWTEVFILQNGDKTKGQEVDFSKLAENIAKATCQALVKYLDLLSSNDFYKIAIRTTLNIENVSYYAGSNGTKLPPIYMKSLDNELIPVLHRITTNNLGETTVVLELVFRILNA